MPPLIKIINLLNPNYLYIKAVLVNIFALNLALIISNARMKKLIIILVALISFQLTPNTAKAQIDEDQLGAWYMYFWNTTFEDGPWGLQGDVQYRNWNVIGDLEQLLLRGGLTYQAEGSSNKYTLGIANITTGAFGDSDATVSETRFYQEALLPHRINNRVFLTHRFRYEQRFVESQDFRTRYRYNLFLNIPLTDLGFGKGSLYLAFYNELFINGQRDIGDGRTVQYFDRNRTYGALGYGLKDNLKTQLGYMQQTTNAWSKGQLQFSLHHTF
ncbi:MAG: hypothetical protein Sapg2KO_04260 [Saprospiraceae bacterium]